MSKILVEFDEEELKSLIAGILAERVMNILPMSTKTDIAKQVRQEVKQKLAEKLMKEVETV